MADNVNVTPGTGNIIAADEINDPTLGVVKVQYVKLMDGTLDGATKASVGSNGLKVDPSGVTSPISGSVSVNNFPVSSVPATDQVISNLGTVGNSLTVTLPAVTAQYHYITAIEMVMYPIANTAGGTTPTMISTTNLPGSLSWIFDTLGTKGQSISKFFRFTNALKSSVINTVTTITFPATSSIIWFANIYYYLSV